MARLNHSQDAVKDIKATRASSQVKRELLAAHFESLSLPESKEHLLLKEKAIRILESMGAKVKMEAQVLGVKGRIDVVGYLKGLIIAIECGNTSSAKIEALKTNCDIAIHMPYCWTPAFSLSHTMMVRTIEKAMEKVKIAKIS